MEVLRQEDKSENYFLMADKLKNYLQITSFSTVSNASRDNEENYPVFRIIKTKLRKVIMDEFYPFINDVKSEYVKGVTYAEKFDKLKKQTVFPRSAPKTDCLLYVFLIMDNIFVPSDITAFTQMLHRSYMGDHLERSEAYGLQHSKLWDSETIWRYFNKFVVYLTTLMKEKAVVKIMPFLTKFAGITGDRLLRQKIGHTAHQYSFYIGLTIASEIGLFPLLTNAELKAQTASNNAQCQSETPSSEVIEKFNVFSYLLYLFGVSNTNETEKETTRNAINNDETTRNFIDSDEDSSNNSLEASPSVKLSPLQIFAEEVLANYLLPVYESVKDKSQTKIPVGYEEFVSQGHGDKVTNCVETLLIKFPSLSAKFRSKLSKQDNVLTRTKIRIPKDIKDDDVITARESRKRNKKGTGKEVERPMQLPQGERNQQDRQSVNNEFIGTITNGTSLSQLSDLGLGADMLTFSASEDLEDFSTNIRLESPFLLWLHERKLLVVSPKTIGLDNLLSRTTGSIITGAFVESIFRIDELSTDKALLPQIMIMKQFQKCGHKPIVFVTTKELDGVSEYLQKFLAIDTGDCIDSTTTNAHIIYHQRDQCSLSHYSTQVTIQEALQFHSMKQFKASLTLQKFYDLIASADHVVRLSDSNGLKLLFGIDELPNMNVNAPVPVVPFAVDCLNAVGNILYDVMIPRHALSEIVEKTFADNTTEQLFGKGKHCFEDSSTVDSSSDSQTKNSRSQSSHYASKKIVIEEIDVQEDSPSASSDRRVTMSRSRPPERLVTRSHSSQNAKSLAALSPSASSNRTIARSQSNHNADSSQNAATKESLAALSPSSKNESRRPPKATGSHNSQNTATKESLAALSPSASSNRTVTRSQSNQNAGTSSLKKDTIRQSSRKTVVPRNLLSSQREELDETDDSESDIQHRSKRVKKRTWKLRSQEDST